MNTDIARVEDKRRNCIIILFKLFAFVGMVCLLFVFGNSLRPASKVEANRSYVDVSKMSMGTYQFIDEGTSVFLVMRDYDSSLYVYWLPTSSKGTLLPDKHWNSPFYTCTDFGPERIDERMKESGVIKCHDKVLDRKEFTWTYAGKNLGEHTDDMRIPKYRVEGDYLVLESL
ncbi:MAG: hypothetical protein ACI9J2_000834 [Saprospiraceae bacterium]|jgi:hypothetical protein